MIFPYQVKGNQLFIDFSNEAARDCTYTFSVNDNTLTLTGGEGTIGGTCELYRQESISDIFLMICSRLLS